MDKADAKPAGSKPANTKSPSSDAVDKAAPSKTDGDGAKPKKDPPRPASFFSSVRSDEYRVGWDSVFGRTKSPTSRRKGPVTLELSATDLTEDEFAGLLAAAQRKAGSRRASLEWAAKKGEFGLSIVWRFGRGRDP